jgi:uncharacterized protein (DUF58 family)
LISFETSGRGTDIKQALEYFNHVNKKRTIAFLISDFIDDGYDTILRVISKKHDVIAVALTDPREEELPQVGLMKLRDAETGHQRWIDTSNASVQSAYRSFWEKRRLMQRDLFMRSRVDTIPIRVDEPYIKPIVDFFRLRERRL